MYDNPTAGTPPPGPWGSPPPYGYPFPPPPPAAPDQHGRPILPIVSLVVSIIALIGVVGVAGWLVTSESGLFDGGAASTPTGQLIALPKGAALPGPDLAIAVTQVLEEDDSEVTMACPATPRVDQGVVTICHGTIDGDDWAVVVFFEDPGGHFILQPL